MQLSVIIPVYNAEQYLRSCLDSIVHQTLQDFEAIVIDDGSTDQSYCIMLEYKEKYPNIFQLFHNENQGISRTRNFGIQHAKGTYIAFLDSDDFIEPCMYEKMLKQTCETKADLVVCDYYDYDEENRTRTEQRLISFEKTNIYDMPSLLVEINPSPWNKLYLRSFLLEYAITFPNDLKYEDAYFVLKALKYAKSITKVNDCLLNYVIHQGSETTVMNERVFDIFQILDMIYQEYRALLSNKEIYSALEYFFIFRITIYNLQQIRQSKYSVAMNFIDTSFVFMQQYFPHWKKNKFFHERNHFLRLRLKQYKTLTKVVVCCLRCKGGSTT